MGSECAALERSSEYIAMCYLALRRCCSLYKTLSDRQDGEAS
jgi:hypothetical protein